MLNKAEIYHKNSDKGAAKFEAIRSQALAIAEKYEMEAALTTSLQTGAVESLKQLAAMKLKIGLCTTSSEKAALYILKRFKIDEFFKVTVVSRKG